MQGLEADILRLMLVRAHDVLSEVTGLRSRVLLSAHDEILLEVGRAG
jgi:DNA polymerase I-like protein with 3'-5' exonuclease and polymerase domains